MQPMLVTSPDAKCRVNNLERNGTMAKNMMTILIFLLGIAVISVVAIAILLDKQFPSPV